MAPHVHKKYAGQHPESLESELCDCNSLVIFCGCILWEQYQNYSVKKQPLTNADGLSVSFIFIEKIFKGVQRKTIT